MFHEIEQNDLGFHMNNKLIKALQWLIIYSFEQHLYEQAGIAHPPLHTFNIW